MALQENMLEFKAQLEKGKIQAAFQGLLEYMLTIKNHFAAHYPHYSMPGGLYTGYMDMTYFSIVPDSFKEKELKIAIVFVYDSFRFEVWLSGKNKQVLTKFWKEFSKQKLDKYILTEPGKGVDAIIMHPLLENPDFNDLDQLTSTIEAGTFQFITDMETLLL
jgi:hypothetical protein